MGLEPLLDGCFPEVTEWRIANVMHKAGSLYEVDQRALLQLVETIIQALGDFVCEISADLRDFQ
jgi:hypothetical protein